MKACSNSNCWTHWPHWEGGWINVWIFLQLFLHLVSNHFKHYHSLLSFIVIFFHVNIYQQHSSIINNYEPSSKWTQWPPIICLIFLYYVVTWDYNLQGLSAPNEKSTNSKRVPSLKYKTHLPYLSTNSDVRISTLKYKTHLVDRKKSVKCTNNIQLFPTGTWHVYMKARVCMWVVFLHHTYVHGMSSVNLCTTLEN